MTVLIDSTVLIHVERTSVSPSALALELGEPGAMSAITLSELLFGLERAATSDQKSRRQTFIEAALEDFPVVPFDEAVARIHARIWAQLVTSGQAIGTHDFMIAATALTYDYALLSDNVREFSRVPGLTVRRPNW
jgi:tRNA(fMet)-specific endonuclease VapC